MQNQSQFPQITHHIGRVESLNNNGYGVIQSDDSVGKIEIPFCLPDEIVIFDKLQYKRTAYYAMSKVVDNPNLMRKDPLCPHFTICGGCILQHMSDEFYAQYKLQNLISLLPQNHVDKIKPITIIPNGLRRKANFEIVKKNDKIFLGFHRLSSRQIINLETCKILRSEIVKIIHPLKNLMSFILNDFEKAELFITLAENGLDIGFEIQNVKLIPEEKRQIIVEFCNQNNIKRFTFRHRKFFDEIFHLKTEENPANPYIKFANYHVSITPWSFVQTSEEAENAMIDEMNEILGEIDEKKSCIDLFSGRGTYTFSLYNKFEKIKAIELSQESINALNEARDEYVLNIESEVRNLFENPISAGELQHFGMAIINPPRAGAENQSIELAKSDILDIIYVSCNPETFVRDLKILEKRYKLISIKPIDQFIWSNHLEIVCHLTKI